MHGFAISPHKGRERTRTLNLICFNHPPTCGGRTGCALFRDFAPYGQGANPNLEPQLFNNPPTCGGRIGCALFRDFAPQGQGANPNLKPQVCPHWVRACRWPLVCLRRVFEKTLNPFAGGWVVKGWDLLMNTSMRRIVVAPTCPTRSNDRRTSTK